MLQCVKYATPNFLKQRYKIKTLKWYLNYLSWLTSHVLSKSKLFLQILKFVRVIEAPYGVIYVRFSTTPYKIIGILLNSSFIIFLIYILNFNYMSL